MTSGCVRQFQTTLGNSYSPACYPPLVPFDQYRGRERLFQKELKSLDDWRFCYKAKPWDIPSQTVRPSYGDRQQECDRKPIGGGTAQNTIPTPSVSGGGACGGPEISILTPERPTCDYGDHRLWGLWAEKFSNATYGNVVPDTNSHRHSNPMSRTTVIYTEYGMNPSYHGHVPGAKFQVGKTYAAATSNARRSIQLPYNSPLCFPPRL